METLSDLCRWKIFNHLHGSNILSFAEPNFSWSQFKSTFSSPRTSLVVLIGTDPVALVESYETLFYLDNRGNVQMRDSLFDYLSVPKCTTITGERVQFLADLFPRTTELVVVFDHSELANDLEHVIDLLEHFSPRLVSLSLYVAYKKSDIDNTRSARLLTVINNWMQRLKVLKLNFKKRLYNIVDGRQIEIRLPILARLEHFEYDLRDSIEQLYSSLAFDARSNENLQNIQINSQITPQFYNLLLNLPLEFALRFQGLNLDITPMPIDFVTRCPEVCDRFVNLTRLHIRLAFIITQNELIAPLTPLTQLTTFTLETYTEVLRCLRADQPLPKLPSVKIFQVIICAFGFTHSHSTLPKLNAILPNLQVLRLETKNEVGFTPRGSCVPFIVKITRQRIDQTVFRGKVSSRSEKASVDIHFLCDACLEKFGLDLNTLVNCHWQTVKPLLKSCEKLKRIEIGNGTYLFED